MAKHNLIKFGSIRLSKLWNKCDIGTFIWKKMNTNMFRFNKFLEPVVTGGSKSYQKELFHLGTQWLSYKGQRMGSDFWPTLYLYSKPMIDVLVFYLATPGYYVHKHIVIYTDSAEWQAERRPVTRIGFVIVSLIRRHSFKPSKLIRISLTFFVECKFHKLCSVCRSLHIDFRKDNEIEIVFNYITVALLSEWEVV